MNWKYKVEDHEYILNQQEHEKVRDAINKGGGLVILREGDLSLNTHFIRWHNKTDSLTDIEESRRIKTPRLAEGKRSNKNEFSQITHNDIYKRMGWSHKEDCICRVVSNRVK